MVFGVQGSHWQRFLLLTRNQELLRKPDPLDLATVVAPEFSENQGEDSEEAFRAVGLRTVRVRGSRRTTGDNGFGQGLVSPPHLFWKAVVVAPSRSRGHVGGWLEAKFGGGSHDASQFLRELYREGVCPALQPGDSLMVDDASEISCGGSATAKLIHRSIR